MSDKPYIAVKHQINSMVVEGEPGGNLLIYASHTPYLTFVVQRADIEDLAQLLIESRGRLQLKTRPT